MKKLIALKKQLFFLLFPRVHRWHRCGRFLDSVLSFWEPVAAKARRKLERLLEAADKRIPRCLPRPRAQLVCEGLENRFLMTTVQLSGTTFSTLQNSGT